MFTSIPFESLICIAAPTIIAANVCLFNNHTSILGALSVATEPENAFLFVTEFRGAFGVIILLLFCVTNLA